MQRNESKRIFWKYRSFLFCFECKVNTDGKLTSDILLKEGDSLSEFGMDAEIIELPGHTAGSIGIKLGEDSMLVGDALMHMTKAGPSLLFEEYDQMLESVRKVQNMGDLKIYFGHGKMVQNRKWV